MKTVNINGKRVDVSYRTNSGMRTKAEYDGRVYNNGLGCDVYDVADGEHIVLILTTSSLAEILKSTTILTNEKYAEIADLYDPYAGGRYHTALLRACGADNLLELR